MGIIIVLHALVCICLVTIILMQSGRGGGLTEAFSGAESMFGAQTNVFLIRVTAVLSTLFLVTCLSLAILSAQKNASLMEMVPSEETQKTVAGTVEEVAAETAETATTTAEEVTKTVEGVIKEPVNKIPSQMPKELKTPQTVPVETTSMPEAVK